MFVLGHIGIAAGLAFVVSRLAGGALPAKMIPPGSTKAARNFPDLRFTAFGALLPDLIDKPLGLVILAGTLDNGRLLAHTLLFLMVLLTVAALRRNMALMAVSLGVASHHALDRMWTEPFTLMWPLYGPAFPAESFEYGHWLDMLSSDPYTMAGEVTGAVILVALFLHLRLHRQGALKKFILTGRTSVE